MVIDPTNLRPEDLEAFTRWVREQKNYYSDLERRLTLTLSSNAMPLKTSGLAELSDDDTTEAVYTILRKQGGWMASGEIREEFKKMTGKEIERLALRTVLKAGEDVRFERQGEARFTVWKAL